MSPPAAAWRQRSPAPAAGWTRWPLWRGSWTVPAAGRDRRRDLGAGVRRQRHLDDAADQGSAAGHGGGGRGRDREHLLRGLAAGSAAGVAYTAAKHAVNGLTKSTAFF